MSEVYGVIFKNNGKMYYFNGNNLDIKLKSAVIVETGRGLQLGTVITEKRTIDEKTLSSPLKNILRIATSNDLKKYEKNQVDAQKALPKIKELVKKNNLKMQVIGSEYTFDRKQLIIRFISDSRIDFRNLVKDLAVIYKTRIELRQVGARDKAKEVGGIGMCGQVLCCTKFLNDLDSVSINMAKNQNISLNPNKINGCCGRLLCCLKYENECYTKCRKDLPLVGKKITTNDGTGTVVSLSILKRKYSVEYPNKEVVEYILDEEA